MGIEIDRLVEDIIKVTSEIIEKDVTTLRGFSRRQVNALAKQAELISSGLVSGDIDEDLKEFFLDSLEDMALNFVKTLRGLLLITIERVWNAIVNVFWEAINSVIGINLVAPSPSRML